MESFRRSKPSWSQSSSGRVCVSAPGSGTRPFCFMVAARVAPASDVSLNTGRLNCVLMFICSILPVSMW